MTVFLSWIPNQIVENCTPILNIFDREYMSRYLDLAFYQLSPVQRVYLWASIVQTMVNLGGLYFRRDDCFLLCCEFWMRLENYVLQYWTFILVFWSYLCRVNFDILSSVFYHLLSWYFRQILQNCQSHWRDVLEFSQDPNIGAVVKALPHVIKCAKSDTRNQNNPDVYRSGNTIITAETGNQLCPITWLNKYISLLHLNVALGGYLFTAISFMEFLGV